MIIVQSGRGRNRSSARFAYRGLSACLLFGATMGVERVDAQAATPNLVSACSGVSLPRSVVTGILTPVVNGIVTPVQATVNPILGVVGAVLPLVPPLSIDAAGLLAGAAAGAPITLQVLNRAGQVVGPTDQCDSQADSFTLRTPAGIAIGGNRITGLGATGLEASAGEIGSIAFGNSATTAASAVGSVAIGRGAAVGANATGSVVLGNGALTSAANSVALGAGSTAARGALAGYAAVGLAAPQTSAGEVSVGAAGAPRQITNVAAGSAATDAVNVGQLSGVAAQVATIDNSAVKYNDATKTLVTLGGVGGTTITNVKAGALNPTSTDAVNGSQLNATNLNVAGNTSAITNLTTNVSTLTTNVANGAIGPVRYSNAATPTTPNGGVPSNDVTLVGAAAGPVGLHNVANGVILPGSTDAVNGGQIFQLGQNAVNAVTYNTNIDGTRTNSITLVGGNAAAPVNITNVAPATLAAGSTGAVNGGQLFTTNLSVTAAQTTANTALTLGQNSVQYDPGNSTSVTLNPGGAASTLHNVAPGVSGTDGVNVAQLNSGLNAAVTQANGYTDGRIAALAFDLRSVRKASYAGTAGALAAAGLPQAFTTGKGMIAMAGGTYRGQSAFAIGASKAFNDGHTVAKFGASFDTNGGTGASGGIGYQF